jgi:hypothetical protein
MSGPSHLVAPRPCRVLSLHIPGPPRSPALIEISSSPPNTRDFPRFGAGASATDEGNLLALHPTVKPVAMVAKGVLFCIILPSEG